MTGQNPQQQGHDFEELLLQLLERLLRDDLGYELLEHFGQAAGSQFGKDIQMKWRTPDGLAHFWHFEAKGHRQPGRLALGQVADKLLAIDGSAHGIDVWCLALAEQEPANELDEKLAELNAAEDSRCHLTVLSPSRNNIKALFACHPDLYHQLYEGEAMPSIKRPDCIAQFRRFLEDATRRGREQALRPSGPWQLVQPERLRQLPDRPADAADYLSARVPVCPWEAVVHGWAVHRDTACQPLLDAVCRSEPGFSYLCLTGAGGEGKSTVLKQVAWDLANSGKGWIVACADGTLGDGPVSVPVKWLESLGDGARVLLVVDDVREVGNTRAVASAVSALRARDQRLFLIMGQRTYDWRRSSARTDLSSERLEPDKHTRPLDVLDPDEQNALAALLHQRGLLHGTSVRVAQQRIRQAAERAAIDGDAPYLLPTMMQLTDPEDRKFEAIIGDILDDLAGIEGRAAFRLLLATALVHAAGARFPRTIGERIVEAEAVPKALELLSGELSGPRWGLVKSMSRAPGVLEELWFTHHRVVAEGLVREAYRSHEQEFLRICRDIPQAMAPDVDQKLLLPQHLFDILDLCLKYLDNERARCYEPAAALAEEWARLDDRLFPVWHRLAECYVRWVQHNLKQNGACREDLAPLADAARAAYRESMVAAHRVLVEEEPPPPLAKFSYREHEFKAQHARSVLEGVMAHAWGTDKRARPYFLSAIMLALLSLEPENRAQNAKATGTLAVTLVNYEQYELAARVVAASQALGNPARFLSYPKAALRRAGCPVPDDGEELLDRVVARLTVGELLPAWRTIGLYDTHAEHVTALLGMLRGAKRWVPDPIEISDAIVELEAINE